MGVLTRLQRGAVREEPAAPVSNILPEGKNRAGEVGEAGVPALLTTPSLPSFGPGVERAPPTHIPGLLEEVTDPRARSGKVQALPESKEWLQKGWGLRRQPEGVPTGQSWNYVTGKINNKTVGL